MKTTGIVLHQDELRSSSLNEAWREILERARELARDFDSGVDDKTVSETRVRRLGVREANGRALF